MSTRSGADSIEQLCEFALTIAFFVVAAGTALSAQTAGFAPLTVGDITVSGSLRSRLESWDWFGDASNGSYTYPGTLLRIGLSETRKRHNWNVEFSVPLLFALPPQPPGAGPSGLGANYFVANDRNRSAASGFAKQAFVRFKDLAGVTGQSLKIGRMEFFDGGEVAPKNPTLAALKRDRVASRLLANFGFTHVQRSFDGVQYTLDRPGLNVTVLGARPTQGVFQVDGWGELNINVVYGALTRQVGGADHAGEWRLFGIAYNDRRNGIAMADNRPSASRQFDHDDVSIGTLGGHYIGAVERPHGTVDILLWGAAQLGAWDNLAHRAGAFAAEGGWQPRMDLAPWIRGGVDYASGDGDPNDSIHGTFFQLLPTPRLYARLPFFNLMNSVDAFGELMLKPSTRVMTRVDIHSLRVADENDLWYQGGGAFQPETFGYVGQPVGGQRGLATLYDASVGVAVTSRIGMGAYYAYASGGPASATSFPAHNTATFWYVEFLIRF
jgi:Alginate export